MPNNVNTFAVTADDVARARRFYENVFDWNFEPWGPPEFYLIRTGDEKSPGITGLMHKRREPVTGKGMTGFECTIDVESIDPIIRAIEAHGGTIVISKFNIPTVGTGVCFHDTEGNFVTAMERERSES